jgi:hypothetical protein
MVHDKQQDSPKTDTARSLADAASSENSLQGYAAINNVDENSEIARRAHEFWTERQRAGQEGTADDDWFRAEDEVLRKR